MQLSAVSPNPMQDKNVDKAFEALFADLKQSSAKPEETTALKNRELDLKRA